ncbi:MAG TPA: helix-turn-helix domain-containing protein [Polyangiaceae bacterium]|nr:helix-turn-helix domain-containing protein [Polyangiaceae bacterium]
MKSIAILAYPGCSGAQVLGLHDSLLLANRVSSEVLGREAAFAVRVVGVTGRSVPAAGGIRLSVERASSHPDLLIVPGFALNEQGIDENLTALAAHVRFISETFRRGTPIAGVCVGAFLLGAAGLLEGRRATTAWMFAPELARRHPTAQIEARAILIEDGGVITTGGFSVAFDLAAHLIRHAGGEDLACAFSKFAMLDVRRDSQLPFTDTALLAQASGAFSKAVQQWLEKRLKEPYRLDRLAQAFAVSPRTLLRRFLADTGESPLSFLQRARIEMAKGLLASTALSVADITEAVGYANVSTFVRLFGRYMGSSPNKYRQQFRLAARSRPNAVGNEAALGG